MLLVAQSFKIMDSINFTTICQKFRFGPKIRVAIIFGEAKGWHNDQATCHQRRQESEGTVSIQEIDRVIIGFEMRPSILEKCPFTSVDYF